MALIDLESLVVDVVEVSREELLAALDQQSRELLGISAEELLDAVRNGRDVDDPAAARLEVLARALIERE